MDFQRSLLFVALGLVLFLLWQSWEIKQQGVVAVSSEVSVEGLPATPSPTASPGSEAVPGAPLPEEGASPAQMTVEVPGSQLASTGRIMVETDLLEAEIDLMGGDLRSARLLQHTILTEESEIPFTLMTDSGDEVFIAQSGLVGRDRDLAGNERDYPNHTTQFSASQPAYRLGYNENTLVVQLEWSAPDGVVYKKIYTFHRDSYLIDLDFEVDNLSNTKWNGHLYSQFQRSRPLDEGGFGLGRMPSYTGSAFYTPESRYEKYDFDDMSEQDLTLKSSGSWVAILQHYFVAAVLPQETVNQKLYSDVLPGNRFSIGVTAVSPVTVPAGEQGKISSRLYIGPKDQDRLEAAAEGLVLTVDYGWLTPISSPLFWVLNNINKVVNNWGWSIVLLTLLIKLVFFPLSAASYKSMAKMKKLQPRLKTLKERYGDDKQKLNQAMMELYKKDKINPLGGCLPILIQIPVFIALYWVLLESVELRQAPFMLWIDDLSVMDPYYVLPILMGASMFAQQLLNPTPLDPTQKYIMMAMPAIFLVFFLWFPAGLVLYWLVNNVLSIGQQWYITAKFQKS